MPNVLVIDDDQDFLDATRLVLEKAGLTVETALTAEGGVEKVRQAPPDLIVLDVMLPAGYEGFDVARTIREQLQLRDLPIVILTSLHERKKVPYRFALDEHYLPVDVFLDKPARPEELVAKIQELLRSRRERPRDPL